MHALTCSIKTATMVTGLSRSTLYNLIDSGQLTRIKVGKRALLKVADIEHFINNSPKG